MIKKHIITTLLLVLSFTNLNANEKTVKHITDLYKSEKLFMNTNMDDMKIYAYSTNMDYKTALNKLKKSLDSSWEQQDIDPEQKKKAFGQTKKQINGMDIFSKDHQMISITHMNMEMEGKKFFLQITINTIKK